MDKCLKEFLENQNIKYKEYFHQKVFSVKESNNIREIKSIPGLRTKSLFLKDENNYFYLITLSGEKRLDVKYLKKQLKIKEMHFASPEEMEKELKVKPGSVSLFCIINSKKTCLIIDQEVINAKEAGFHPNINNSTLVLDNFNINNFFSCLKCKKYILELP